MRRPPKAGEKILIKLAIRGTSSRYELAEVTHVGWHLRVKLLDVPQHVMNFTGKIAREHEGSGWVRWPSQDAKAWMSACALGAV